MIAVFVGNIQNASALSSASLDGTYVSCQYGTDPDAMTSMYELTFDGSGNGTYQEIVDSHGPPYNESGSFTYSVATDGMLTVDGVETGIVSPDGNVMSWIDYDTSDNSLSLFTAIKKSTEGFIKPGLLLLLLL